MRIDLAIAVVLIAGNAVQADPKFLPEPVPAHQYDGGWEHFVGGGVAAFDCDGDHLPELYAAGGSNPAQLMRNRGSRGGALRFTAETPTGLALRGVIGAYPLDIDGDGLLDLAILRVGGNLLMRGGGNCSFGRFELPGFIAGDRWTTAFSATWEPEQDLPTLAFGNYVDRDNPEGPFEACDQNQLFRPNQGTYQQVFLNPGYCPLSMLFSDWGRTGQADLRISNDRHYYVTGGQEQLWRMTSEPRALTTADGWNRFRLWGMGIASRDLDFDGRPEVFLTSMGDQRLQFLTAKSGPGWQDAPYALGTTAHRPFVGDDGRPSTGWHVAFGDVQNDGRDDVFIAKGNVEQMPGSAMQDPNSLLLQHADGSFGEVGDSAGVASMHRSRGAALVDLNLDGLLDLAVVNRRAPLQLYRNVSADSGHWLSIALHQPAPNSRAVGGFLELDIGSHIMVREITVGGGHASGSAVAEHFGLGSAEQARLRVIWPDGATSQWAWLTANQHLRVARRDGDFTVSAY